jgi:LysM repeat protein
MALVLLTACGEVITPEAVEDTPGPGTPQPEGVPTRAATATAPLLPPADTATPTVTPTPVVHVVEAGESLYSIAFDYGVSPDVLQAINNIEDPQFLSIGQRLTIPSGETPEETTDLLLPTPTPLPFGVRGIGFYETPVGSLWCLGEAVNTTAVTLTNVQVNVALFDNAGELLVSADAFAAADLVPPGGRSPFGVLFTTPPATWATPQVTAIRGEAAGGLAASYVPISLSEVEGQVFEAQFRVNGTVRNESPTEAAGRVYVIATTYGPEGVVTGFRLGSVEVGGTLAPGAIAPFSLLLSFNGDPPADFSVIALGRVSIE